MLQKAGAAVGHDQPGCGWLNCNPQTHLAATLQEYLSPKRYCFALWIELIKCLLLFLFIRITTASHSLHPPHH